MALIPSTLGAWIPAVLRCLKHYGLQKEEAIQLAGIDRTKLYEADARFNIHDTHQLMQLLQQHVQRPVPGIELAKFSDQTTFGALAFALNASGSIREALQRLSRFTPAISTVIQFSTEAQSNGLAVYIKEGMQATQTSRATFDFCLAIVTVFLRQKGGRIASPIQVMFKHQDDPESRVVYEGFYGCKLAFNSEHYGLLVPHDALDAPILTPHSSETRASFDELLLKAVEKVQQSPLVTQVLDLIVQGLPNGEPSLEDIASQLNISGRTLQRRLKKEDLLFKTLVDEGRKYLSQQYLKKDGYNVTETAYLLGFSDTSSFSRAYRRWFNQSPTESTSV